MRFGIIGAGRLGTALARALAGVGHQPVFLLGRDLRRARRAREAAGVDCDVYSAASLGDLPQVDLLFITTPDDALAETASRLAAAEGERRGPLPKRLAGGRRGVALHTSGALTSEELAPLRERGYAIGSLHPLVAVSDVAQGAVSLRYAFYCVEGEARAVRAARGVVSDLGRDFGAQSFTVPAEKKALYHAAAVMCAGHTVALFDAAASLLAACGLKPREAQRVLLPLLSSAVSNLSPRGHKGAQPEPSEALTGSFARADVGTVRKHLAALEEAGDPEALEIYRLLGRRSLRLAAERGADAEVLAEIARALGGERPRGARRGARQRPA